MEDCLQVAENGAPGRSRCFRNVFCSVLFFFFLSASICALVVYYWPIDRDVLITVGFENRKAGLINSDGRVAAEPEFEEIERFDPRGIASALVGEREWTIIDRKGRVKSSEVWKYILSFDEEGMAPVMKDDKWGVINMDGSYAIYPHLLTEPKFDKSGLALVDRGDKKGWINRDGGWLSAPPGTPISDFGSAGLAILDIEGKKGAIDRNGKLVIDAEWEKLQSIDDNLMIGFSGGRISVLNAKGETVNEFGLDFDGRVISYLPSGEGLIASVGGNVGLYDLQGNELIPPVWDEIGAVSVEPIFGEWERAPVKRGQKWGYIDRGGNVVIPIIWDRVWPFDENGMARVADGEKNGCLNVSGKVVIEPLWESIGPFDENGLAIAERDGIEVLIAINGEVKVPPYWMEFSSDEENEFGSIGGPPATPEWLNSEGKPVASATWSIMRSGEFHRYLFRDWYPYYRTVVVDADLNVVFDEPGQLQPFDYNGITAIEQLLRVGEERMPDHRSIGGFIDVDGEIIVNLRDMGFDWINFDDVTFPTDSWRGNYPQGDYYVVGAPSVPRAGIDKMLYRLKVWLGLEISGGEEHKFLCRCYHKDGTLVWSSEWVRFETKCLFVFAVAIVGAIVTRPRRRNAG